MAQVDTSFYQNMLPPAMSENDYMKQRLDRNVMQRNEDEAVRALGESNKLREVIGKMRPGDDTGNMNMLYSNGFAGQANEMAAKLAKIQQDKASAQKNVSDASSSDFKTSQANLHSKITELSNFSTVADIQNSLDRHARSGGLDQQTYEHLMSTMPKSDAEVPAWSMRQVRSMLTPKELADKTMVDANTVANNTQSGLNNAATVGASIENSKRTAKTAANGQAITVRGQDVGESRAEAKRIADESKPLPSQALKMQQTALDAIGVASNTQSDIDAVLKQIDGKKLKFGLVSNALNKARDNTIGSSEESRNLSSFKSSIEKMRNDSLRLNSGVQTDGDAQRAWNELFENINDTELVKQRLGEIKKINARAVGLHKLNVENVRANYGKPELDTSRYENQGAAIGGAYSDAEKERRYQQFKAGQK
jgi:hypothetical protein